MKVLLDTNIVIHREASKTVERDIGVLFKWLDDLRYQKYLHPLTITEIEKHKDPIVVGSFKIKLANYNVLKTLAPIHALIQKVCVPLDTDENDANDTRLLNEVINDRVDILITEDADIVRKAGLMSIADRVFTIDAFLEKATVENPGLKDYRVLAARKEHFGNLNLGDGFFTTLKEDYARFESWFNRKSDEIAYVCTQDEKLLAFLYLKLEQEDEDYSDITPPFVRKKRLKIGTLKVDYNGFKLGERFLKIVFDNALRLQVDEIYVTIFDRRPEQLRLIGLLESFGFKRWGHKNKTELVYVRDFSPKADREAPKLTFPYVSAAGQAFIVPIYPEYHTSLLPDSILKTESADDFVENEPFRNAISKVYICRSIERDLKRGDPIIFYRTGGYYKSVVTTIGIVESVTTDIKTEADFIRLCGKRSVFSQNELSQHWNYNAKLRPFIVNFLYAYSFPKRITLKDLIDLKIIPNIESAPRGFQRISREQLKLIARGTNTDASLIID